MDQTQEIEVGPTGYLVKGNVFDWPLAKITKAVQKIEPRLYFKWNPKKNNGYGIWELRIRPTKKTPIYQGEFNNTQLFSLETVESELEHHIKDFESINGQVINWLHDHDTQTDKNWVKKLDESYYTAIEKAEQANAENRRYVAKHYRKEFRELLELTKSGYDPMGWAYHKPKK